MDIILAEVAKGLSIFGLAWFSFWTAIPAGLALGIHPIPIILITSTSYISGILICILPAQSVRTWVMKRFSTQLDQSTQDNRFIMRLWHRYGIIGFGLIAPMTVGAQLGAIIGIALNIPRRKLVLWMIIGVIAWSVGLTLLAVAGVGLVTSS